MKRLYEGIDGDDPGRDVDVRHQSGSEQDMADGSLAPVSTQRWME
jgi:hypothetical protein